MQQDPNERLSRPNTKAGRLQRAVLDLLREHEARGELPTSNRFLYYELVQRRVLDKAKTRRTGRGSDQDLADASKRLRDASCPGSGLWTRRARSSSGSSPPR